MKSVFINNVSSYLPTEVVVNETIEAKIRYDSNEVDISLEKIFDIQHRRKADQDQQVSDLAYNAAIHILDEIDHSVDLLIFAAASSDLIEPSTSAIVQHKLGLKCPTMDIKNACNSFTTAIQTASAFIQSEIYTNVLIVNGEKISKVVKFDIPKNENFVECLSAFTLGDAGCAMLVSNQNSGGKLVYQNFFTRGDYWNLCTIRGGGSLALHEMDAYYFRSDSTALKDACLLHGVDFVNQCFKDSGIDKSAIKLVIPHQVSGKMSAVLSSHLGIDESKFMNTFSDYGNTAAASIPLALDTAIQQKRINKGDLVLLLGMAAGISISFQIIKY